MQSTLGRNRIDVNVFVGGRLAVLSAVVSAVVLAAVLAAMLRVAATPDAGRWPTL
jgi:hypothetical protein